MKLLSCVRLLATPWTAAHQAPPSMDFPGKNTGVGCHFLLQCMKVKSESEVAQSCPTLCDSRDGSPPGSLSLGFSRQEHWSGLLFPSSMHESESEVTQSCQTLSDPMECMGFSRQEYWSGVPLPSAGRELSGWEYHQ